MLGSNGQVVGDGTWELPIYVTDMKMERKLRVRGDMHIGGAMLRLVEDLDVTRDWSDHALWWPKKNRWLKHTRSTIDQCGLSSDSSLHFTPMHKVARVQLPDLQFVDARLDFSVAVFSAVINLCRDLAIRHPEEMSFKRYLTPEELKRCGTSSDRRTSLGIGAKGRRSAEPRSLNDQHFSQSAYNISSPTLYQQDSGNNQSTIYRTPPPSGTRGPATPGTPNTSLPPTPVHHQQYGTLQAGPRYTNSQNTYMATWNGTMPGATLPRNANMTWEGVMDYDQNLVNSNRVQHSHDTMEMLFKPKNLSQKANLNRGWLDSSISLLEQGIAEYETILLRFKFSTFFDLNPKYDPVRVNQIYEQAKWTVLLEELDTTEEEAFLFAALQLQIKLQANSSNTNGHVEDKDNDTDEVEAALDDLELTLEGSSMNNAVRSGDITAIPELEDELRVMKPKKLSLKAWKQMHCSFKDLNIAWFPSGSHLSAPPVGKIYLKGCEVIPDVNLAQHKFIIKVLVPNSEGMTEYLFRCPTEKKYAEWMAACKLASRGKTMADSATYAAEKQSIEKLFDMQRPVKNVPQQYIEVNQSDVNPEELISSRYLKKFKSRSQAVDRILKAHVNVKNLALDDAKMQYIKAWNALPEYGLHYFVIKFATSKKPDLICVAYNRIQKMDMDSGESLKTWRFTNMEKWHVNWQIKRVLVQMENNLVLDFGVLSADCKVVHEFIGGYIFLSLRSKDQNQVLNEELFHKLTGGRYN